jgi:anti-anti-sigma factor
MPYVVEIGGDIDMATVEDLEQPVIQAIRDGRRPVILDLSECPFIDSSGLRLLVRARHLLHEDGDGDGRHLLAVVASDHVAGVLQLTAIDRIVAVAPSRGQAEGMLDLG